MAATVTVQKAGVPGDSRWAIVTVQGDTSYPTGGYAVDLSAAGVPTKRFGVLTDMTNSVSGVVQAVWVDGTGKLKLMSAAGTEVTNATNVAGSITTLLFIGF